MGTPELAVPCLEHLLIEGYEVVAVYTQPDRPAGRGRGVSMSPVKRAALAHGLPVMQPESLRQPEALAGLAALKPDAIVVAAYGQILSQAVLDIPPRRCINVHFSLLPRHRGAAPVAAAILAGDEFTGISIMLVERKLDAGPVLARAAVGISGSDTTGSLVERLAAVAARLLPDVLGRWLRGEIEPQPQDESLVTCTGSFSKEAGDIDWRLPALQLWRQVRAFTPWPGSYTRWQGRNLRVLEALPVPSLRSCRTGEVVALEGGFGVCAGEGILEVRRVQLEGKQAMSAADFLRGQRGFIGAILPG